MAGEPGYLRWTPTEWLKVAAHAIPHLDKGVPPNKALERAQRTALDKDRRRDEESLRKLVWRSSTQKYLDAARAMPQAKRDEIAPPPPPRKKPEPRKKLDEGRDYGDPAHPIKWTTLEKARIARQVEAFRQAGDTRKLSRLIIEAQELALDRDRRRPIRSIHAGTTGGFNDQLIEDGRANQWLLTAAEQQAKDDAAKDAELPQVEQPQQQTENAVTQEAPQAPQGDAVLQPSLALTNGPRAFSEAATAFGETVMGALDKLLAVHTETLLTQVYAKFSESARSTSEQIASQVAIQIAAHIERGMRETVHKIVEVELGGPVSPPTAGEAPAPEPIAMQAPQPAESEKKRPLKVDVVGLVNGSMEQEVRTAINGHADLRFFDPDSKSSYAPHRGRHCIIVTHRIPHTLKDKIKASGIEPIYVKSTPGHVIHAIEELHRSHG